MVTLKSIPFISFPTALLFVLQVRGYSRLYLPSNFAWPHLLGDIFFSTISFLLFTDSLFYWIHRGFHHRSVYKYLHKVHHRWKVPTPFASHAFHPVEGFFHSLPYHLFPFLFPLNMFTWDFSFSSIFGQCPFTMETSEFPICCDPLSADLLTTQIIIY